MTEYIKHIDIYIESSKSRETISPIGRWIKLPMDKEELSTVISDILISHEDNVIIIDYTAPFRINDYTDITLLNDALLKDIDMKIFSAIMNLRSSDISETLSIINENKYTIAKGRTEENPNYHILEIKEFSEIASLMAISNLSISNISKGFIDGIGFVREKFKEFLDYEAIGAHLETGYGWNIDCATNVAICFNEKSGVLK
jgi:hypothetical protein